MTDKLGWCYVAHCSSSCQVETRVLPCPTTPTLSTTTPSTSIIISSTSPAKQSRSTSPSTEIPIITSTTVDCTYLSPPRKNGESWKENNCTTLTCINGKITKTTKTCDSTEKVLCTNGLQPDTVYDDDGCCFKYECPCECSVLGVSNYNTFDGELYTFNEKCSYYLVKEIQPKYSLTVILHNNCYGSDITFCRKAFNIIYKDNDIVLMQQNISGSSKIQVTLNNETIYPGFSNSDVIITGSDMVINLKMPSIETTVTFTQSGFSINVPTSLFKGNTEGQCGTCDNSLVNECRSPNGHVVNCSESAPQWEVPGIDCIRTTTSTPISTTAHATFTTTPCQSGICTILTSSLFEPCHTVVAPEKYLKMCESITCNGREMCSSVEAYATACATAGVCIDWRNSTNGQCEHKCPSGKVYKACGPSVEPTCNKRFNDKFDCDVKKDAKEGCFCPEGTILFNKVHDKCVTACGCIGPKGEPKKPGETWESECCTCECNTLSLSVVCKPNECVPQPRTNCTGPGYHLVKKRDKCCLIDTCECNVKLCPPQITCPLGLALKVTLTSCCPLYTCEPKGVCVFNMTEFKVGEKIPTSDKAEETEDLSGSETTPGQTRPRLTTAGVTLKTRACQDCYCTPEVNRYTKLNVIVCTPTACKKECPEGFEYETSPETCCGSCVQTRCIFTLPTNKKVILKVNETYKSPSDSCVVYRCVERNGQFYTEIEKQTCPPFNQLDCKPGTETTDAAGCCKSCKSRGRCQKTTTSTVIEVNDCTSAGPVTMTSCSGHCASLSKYSAAAKTIMRECECCQEEFTRKKQVQLTCKDGSKVQHTFTEVESCRCSRTECKDRKD